jgi:phosphoserine phosphatase RsbU/P
MSAELFDKAPSGYFSFYDDGSIHAVNQTLCDLLKTDKATLQGKNVESIFTLPTRIFYQTHFFPLLKLHGHAEEIFINLLTSDGEHLPVLLNARREQGPKPVTSCSFIVVANRKKFEDELVAARKQAELALRENTELIKAKQELQKHTEALDAHIHVVNKQNHELKQLSHAITHSLKEPLRKILLFTDKLQEYPWPGEAAETLERLMRSSAQMRNIVSGLQQYMWLDDDPVQLSSVNLQQTVRQAELRLIKEAGPGQLLLTAGQMPTIEGDEQQLELLFYHLFSNAVKFKKKEQVRVSVDAEVVQQNRFRAMEDRYHYEDFVKIHIKDDGPGFDPAASEAIFELFRKLDYKNGSGLGLALCRKVADNHFGTIKASAIPNEGAVFTVTLPVNRSMLTHRQAEARAGTGAVAKKQ